MSDRNELLIQVVVAENGDNVWVEDEVAAIAAGHTLRREASEQGIGKPTLRFLVNDELIREVRGVL